VSRPYGRGIVCTVENTDGGRVRVKVGSIAFLAAAGTGYGIGLDDTGRRIEFIGDWSALSTIQGRLQTGALSVEVETWQIIAVNEEIELDVRRPAMVERAAFLQSVVAQRGVEDGVHEP